MPTIGEQLHRYALAVADPTRGMILVELSRVGELTGTQLARRLGLTPNNVYHHMRILLQLGVVEPPRVVPAETYVEKFYHVNPAVQAALRLDPEWYDSAPEMITLEDRQAIVVSMCLTMAHLLRQAARDYQQMDPGDLDRAVRDQQLVTLSINRVSRDELTGRMRAFLASLDETDRKFAEDLTPKDDLILFAGLPSLVEPDDVEAM
jgi:DNA-binding transcriptional ArsR family regulator